MIARGMRIDLDDGRGQSGMPRLRTPIADDGARRGTNARALAPASASIRQEVSQRFRMGEDSSKPEENARIKTRTGGQMLVDQLVAQGVERVFCVPGESYLAVLDALHDANRSTSPSAGRKAARR